MTERMSYCACWLDYPNELHKKKNGKWKCVDRYKCIKQRDRSGSPCFGKTRCVRKED